LILTENTQERDIKKKEEQNNTIRPWDKHTTVKEITKNCIHIKPMILLISFKRRIDQKRKLCTL
jgi:hypothetical protein